MRLLRLSASDTTYLITCAQVYIFTIFAYNSCTDEFIHLSMFSLTTCALIRCLLMCKDGEPPSLGPP